MNVLHIVIYTYSKFGRKEKEASVNLKLNIMDAIFVTSYTSI